jgi:hypothetical protein
MFLTEMPDVQSAKQITVYRAKPGRPICGFLTGSCVRTMSHWYRSKSLPCLKADLNHCPLCDLGINQRYYAYYSLRGRNGTAAMVELTSTAEAQLIDVASCCPKESVIFLTVSRAPGKKNNPLIVSAEYKSCSKEELAQIERVNLDRDLMMRTLIRLWNLPEFPLGMHEKDYSLIVERYITEMIHGNV